MRRYLGEGGVARLLALLGVALMFSGCVTMATESEFNDDGGATHTMTITLDQSAMEQIADLGEGEGEITQEIGQIDPEDIPEGYTVEQIDDGEVVGARLSRSVDDSSNLGDILNELLNASSAEGEEEAFPFSGTFEKDGDDYRIDLTVDGDVLTTTAGAELGDGGEGSQELEGLGLDSIFEFTYTVRLPGEIDEDETNGRIGDDGSVTWDLPLEGQQTFTAVSHDDGGSSSLLLILIVIGIIVLGLIALAAVAFFIFMSRRGTTPATATVAPAGPATPPPPAASVPPSEQPTRPIPSYDPPAQPDDESRPPTT